MSHDIRHGAKIIVEKTGVQYHTYDDWGLYITNANPIGDPVQYTNYVEIRGRNGKIDLSEVVNGRTTYTHRPIKINLMGTHDIDNWDAIISAIRNQIMGQKCRIIFDNDQSYYWVGRVSVIDFSSVWEFGKFSIDIPEADPYKYDVLTSAEPWIWDTFNFETGEIIEMHATVIVGSGSITIPSGHMLTSPNIVVSKKVSGTFRLNYDGQLYDLAVGNNIIPSVLVNGDAEVTLNFVGSATVQVVYRGGSL